ncbi:MAG TPA: sigma-70 family RNA polymerase sigma factor [Thermoanaerobaculia bacterium]|nr:sigma-70 family RNA polymerase sigma factor [Thermoanaerobaculia bacterium]
MSPIDSHALMEREAAVRALLPEIRGGVAVEHNFRRLITLYYQPVLRFFAKRGFTPDDCLDLTQETFLGIYTGIGSFRGDASFDTWLFKIATNVYRKRRRWQSASKRAGEEITLAETVDEEEAGSPLADSESPTPSDEMLARERSQLLRQAVETLPQQMRRCLMLRVYQNLKYREVAAILQISVETVKAHLFQARTRLQRELGGDLPAAFREGKDET